MACIMPNRDIMFNLCAGNCIFAKIQLPHGCGVMKNWQFLCATTMCLAIAAIPALRSSADSPTKAGDVTESRVASDAADGNNWLLNGRTFDAQHFSPLKQITAKNVSGLGLAWYLD